MKICPLCFGRFAGATERCPRDTSALYDLGDPDISPLIGHLAAERFLILDMIGRGGMASVFLAVQLSMSRLVALKVLDTRVKTDPISTERFVLEAKSTAQLRSPHTVVVYDFGQLQSGELFMAMELMEGQTLDAVIKEEGHLAPKRAARLAAQICMSLEEAHQLGMIHRDIKPKNIMIENQGTDLERAKVVDFGLVKLTEGQDFSLTRSGAIQGTPPYMAPEVWSDAFGEPGPSVDIYALGIAMYEMLAGRLPYRAGNIPNLALMHCYNPMPPISTGGGADPRLVELERIVRCCLEKEPGDRPPSAEALRLALEDLELTDDLQLEIDLADTAASVVPPPAPSHRPRSRAPLVVGALVVLAGAGFVLQELDGVDEMQAPSRPIAAVSTEPSKVSAPPPVEIVRPPQPPPPPPPRKPAPPKKSAHSIIAEVRVAGSLPQDSARAVVEKLAPAIERCLASAGRETMSNLLVRLFVRPDGSVSKVRVSPEDRSASRFLSCVQPPALAAIFDPFDGPFSAITVILAP